MFVRMLFVLMVVSLVLTITRGQDRKNPPKINWPEEYNKPQYKPEDVNLICNATGGEISISWRRNGIDILIGSSSEKLKIDVTNKANIGNYQCVARNSLGTCVSDEVWVDRLEYMRRAVKFITDKVKEGGHKKLICPDKDKYKPAPTVRWMKGKYNEPKDFDLNSRRITDAEGDLYLTYFTDEDAGYISCFMIGAKSTSLPAAEYHLTKEGKVDQTDLQILDITKSPIGILGKSITLRCIVSGAEVVEVKWLDSNDNEISGNDVEYLRGSLLIKNLKMSDQKSYYCKANAEGKISIKAEVILKVEEIPNFKSDSDKLVDIYATTNGEAVFRCAAKGVPEPKVEWMKDGVKLDLKNLEAYMSSPDANTIKATNLCKYCSNEQFKTGECQPLCEPRKDMVLSCKASNVHGYIYRNAILKIYKPTTIIKKPENVEYISSKNVTFECKAKTDEETLLSYKWLLNDKEFNVGGVKTNETTLFLNLPSLKKKNINVEGKWTCKVTNQYSVDQADAYLKAKIVAAFPQWWILLLVLVILLLFLLLVCCICNYLYKNRGSVYPVDEIEHKNGNDPEKELLESGFHDFQRDVTISTSGTLRSQRSMGSTNSLARPT